MKIYKINDWMPEIKPAPMSRPWMNATTQGFANRCLPLRVASAHGWEVINPFEFNAYWNGSDQPDGVIISAQTPIGHWAASHFGYGVLTFNMHFLLRTEPGTHTMVTGPLNETRDAIQPLAGIVETDWSWMTFTFNWKFTRPNQAVTWRAGDPVCQFFPVRPALIEGTRPEVLKLSDDPELDGQYRQWSASRDAFHAAIKRGDIDAMKNGWQGDYYRTAKRKIVKCADV